MSENKYAVMEEVELNEESFNFEELEQKLEFELSSQLSDLEILEKDKNMIGNPSSLGESVMNVVWEQFINQVGVIAGEDFIKENRGLTLDLRDSAHVQTTDNFANGKIASHNTYIDYQKRYDDWQDKFERDKEGNIITHKTRTGEEVSNVKSGARASFDKGRPAGSAEKHTDMDHTVPAAEIIRDPAANAHLSQEEQVAFANSEANLNEMDSSHNRSKSDTPMTDWLDNPNKNGQKPSDIWDISEEQDKQYREKDKEAREEYERVKAEGEKKSIEAGKQSQREEAFRIGGKALRAVLMGLLAELIKKIIQKLIAWFRSGKKNIKTFIESVKDAFYTFIKNLKQNLLTAGNTLLTTIATAIWGPVVNTIKKAWIFLKQGYKSLREAIDYVRNSKNKPFSILMLEVGKIIIAGLTAGGAMLLGETIEKGLMTIPIFAFEIPLLGSLASILGIFFGALVSGIIGAIALNLIDKAVAKKQKVINEQQQIEKKNEIIQTQDKLIIVTVAETDEVKRKVANNMIERHQQAVNEVSKFVENIKDNEEESQNIQMRNKDNLDSINSILDNI